jgi:hypothetical protein
MAALARVGMAVFEVLCHTTATAEIDLACYGLRVVATGYGHASNTASLR